MWRGSEGLVSRRSSWRNYCDARAYRATVAKAGYGGSVELKTAFLSPRGGRSPRTPCCRYQDLRLAGVAGRPHIAAALLLTSTVSRFSKGTVMNRSAKVQVQGGVLAYQGMVLEVETELVVLVRDRRN